MNREKPDELKAGIRGHAEEDVTESVTALSMGSGGLKVYATPRMITMMEFTAWSSVEPYMQEGMGTVGTHLDISHVSASPVGAHVTFDSELVEVDGRKLVFTVAAYDDAGKIGEGRHERFIIKNESFMARTYSKIAEKD